jgi:hypothetical protein
MIRFGVDDILNTTELIDSQGNIDYNRITATADMAFASYCHSKTSVPAQYGINATRLSVIIGDFANS